MTSRLDQAKELFRLGAFDKAGPVLTDLLQRDPRACEVWLLLGMVHEKTDNLAAAADVFAVALDLSRDQKKDIGLRAASHYLTVNNQTKAFEILTKLYGLMSQDKEVNHALCSLYREAGDYHRAAPYAVLLAQLADGFEGWLNAGIVLSGLGRMEEAAPLLKKAHEARPDDRLALCEYFWCAASLCDFNMTDRLQARLQDGLNREGDSPDIRESAFRALMWSGDEAYLARASRRTAESLFGQVLPPRTMARMTDRRPGPIRIGYVSCDFYDHATMSLLAGCLEAHDREKFEIHAFCYTAQHHRKGVMRQRFLAACDHMIDSLDVPDELVLQAIRELDIDILIDLKGYTEGSRLSLFAARAAPVQITWLGFPGSVQGVGLDYAITDRFVTPPGSEAFFEEKLLRMPVSYQCNDTGREPVQRTGRRADHGLPDNGIVFSAFHQPVKIRSPVFKVWMDILNRVDASVLWIGQVQGAAQDNLRKSATAHGVDPARLIFAETVPLGAHLRRLTQADLALDTSPCNGHTTTSDALWSGVPVITLKGTSFAGRVSESLLNAVGLAELVAADLSAYVDLAVSLAHNPQRIAGLRTHLLNGRHTLPLFDSARFCRDLEHLYSSLLRPESVLAGKRPMPLFRLSLLHDVQTLLHRHQNLRRLAYTEIP